MYRQISKCTDKCMRASGASELRNFGIFTFLNCYFFQYFVGTSDTLSVQMTCLSAYMYRQISKCTDKCMRASGASELRNFGIFTFLTLTLSKCMCIRNFGIFTFLKLTLSKCMCMRASLENTLSVQVTCLSAYMYRQISKCTDKCMRASGASELRNFGIFTFLNCYFFQYFVGTSDTLSVQMTCLSAYMYRQISKCTDKTPKSIIGGQLPPCPPPSGYANGTDA